MEENVKMNFKEVKSEDVGWILVADDKDRFPPLCENCHEISGFNFLIR
jgi:hypothetical protein